MLEEKMLKSFVNNKFQGVVRFAIPVEFSELSCPNKPPASTKRLKPHKPNP